MRRAVVTGGTGFIGSWLILELLNQGYQVVAVVRSKEKLLKEIRDHGQCFLVEKSIECLQAADFPFLGFDVFYNLAWAGVDSDKKNEEHVQTDNIMMCLRAVRVAGDINCRLFISSGTVAEYALWDGIMDLSRKQTPNDMYGAAKAAVYYLLEVKARQIGIPLIWSIIPSTFGERRADNSIITYTIKTLLKGEKPQYGKLEQMWDFLYVADVARALRMIGEKGIAGKVYGVGSGSYRPLKDYIQRIRDLINPQLELGINEAPSLSGRTVSSCVDTYELIRDTGFSPQYSFEEGIRRTIIWMKSQKI